MFFEFGVWFSFLLFDLFWIFTGRPNWKKHRGHRNWDHYNLKPGFLFAALAAFADRLQTTEPLISAFQSKFEGGRRTFPSPTSITLPSQQSKKRLPTAALFECPRQNAIALGGRERPRRHCGAAPGCRCQRRCRGQRRPWPRSWKSRPGFYTMRIHSPAWNLKVKLQEGTQQLLQHITTSISTAFRQICWIFSTRVHSPGEFSPTSKGMTPYQLAHSRGHAMVLGWLKPAPWHCSWKGGQFIHLIGRIHD